MGAQAMISDVYEVKSFSGVLLADFLGVDEVLLNNHDFLKDVFLSALREDRFDIRQVVFEVFTPQGITIAVILGESHAVVNTYPEKGTCHVSIESCRRVRDGDITVMQMGRALRPRRILLQRAMRVIDPEHARFSQSTEEYILHYDGKKEPAT